MKKNRAFILSMLVVGLALGTAWAVRGRFGHEQGAAWAGAIGALSLILAAKRKDWYPKIFRVAMAAAVGWGTGGVMSYGLIVGYGRSTDFGNAFYGLLMLFLVGGLHGFLGGGFVGLSLLSSREYRIPWHSLITEMIALGLLAYGMLVLQLEWFMTPPRSEMWAACLGAAIALAWFTVRHQYTAVLKVAVCAAMGAGFGFAFGNFLQTLGAVSGLNFNFWNVMEYSIGFFGGIGMAYGVFTSSWPRVVDLPPARSNILPILFVTLLIPFVVWEQSFVTERFRFDLTPQASAWVIPLFKGVALLAVLLLSGYCLWKNARRAEAWQTETGTKNIFLMYTGLYIAFSFLMTGVLVHPPEQYLYLVNLLVIGYLIPKTTGVFKVGEVRPVRWATGLLVTVIVIALLAGIASGSHDGLRGSQTRFGNP